MAAAHTVSPSDGAGRVSHPDNGSKAPWHPFDRAELRKPAVVEEIRALMAQSGDRLLAHDPVWVAGPGPEQGGADWDGEATAVYGLRREGRLVGYAVFYRSIRTLRFAIGEMALYRHRVPSLALVHDITLVATAEPERIRQIRDLFSLLVPRRPPREALYLEGVPTESPLFAVATTPQAGGGWIVVRVGESYQHQYAELPPSFAEYERRLGSRSRQSLRYSRRKLLDHLDGALRVRRFADREDVAAFVGAAQAISQKTYQWNLLKLGLRDGAALTARLDFAAGHGWMRCYILYCRDEPVAFMLGYVYCGVYHYIDVGYDPSWAKWSVGSILQMAVFDDLLEEEDPPDRFDFSTGFGSHKARFGNFSRQEANILLLPEGLRNQLVAGAYRVGDALDKRAGAAADALGIKSRLKKWLRRSAQS